jgi:hypothetical protein
MTEVPKLYDIGIDEFRPLTQEDFDKLQQNLNKFRLRLAIQNRLRNAEEENLYSILEYLEKCGFVCDGKTV